MTCCQIIGQVMKSVPNLGGKTNYVLHYRSHQLYLSLGIRLTKNQKVLKFKQSDWMKKYIDFNFEQKAKHKEQTLVSLEKYFSKLMINSVYGKTMEKLRVLDQYTMKNIF